MSGTLVALSPHLDDAVFSIGAFLHEQVRRGADVHVVTVFANDPAANGPAGSWDAACGFESAAAAARARQAEDRRACTIIGAQPHWLPYRDDTYGPRADDNEVWGSIRGLIGGCDLLLVPGFPLRHGDHVWVARLVVRRQRELPCGLGFYGEQPYASAALARRGRREVTPPQPLAEDAGTIRFERIPAAATDRRAKIKASLQYRSQLRPLGASALLRAYLDERLRGGELVGWTAGASRAAPDDAAQHGAAAAPDRRSGPLVGGSGEAGGESGERAERVGERAFESFDDEQGV